MYFVAVLNGIKKIFTLRLVYNKQQIGRKTRALPRNFRCWQTNHLTHELGILTNWHRKVTKLSYELWSIQSWKNKRRFLKCFLLHSLYLCLFFNIFILAQYEKNVYLKKFKFFYFTYFMSTDKWFWRGWRLRHAHTIFSPDSELVCQVVLQVCCSITGVFDWLFGYR